jgi:hypothetical protein
MSLNEANEGGDRDGGPWRKPKTKRVIEAATVPSNAVIARRPGADVAIQGSYNAALCSLDCQGAARLAMTIPPNCIFLRNGPRIFSEDDERHDVRSDSQMAP